MDGEVSMAGDDGPLQVSPVVRVLSAADVLRAERERLFGPANRDAARDHGAVLCLSGGGVRSAALSLGLLQSLAACRLLTSFNWLSTVSGGGYTGAWLQAWIHNSGNSASDVQAALGGAAEPPEVKRMREWCNYLTPQPGLLSADTWTGITLWIRNVLINWLVFGPALLAFAAVPVAYARLVPGIGSPLAWAGLLVGGGALLRATWFACRWLPSHLTPTRPNYQTQPDKPIEERGPFAQLSVSGVYTRVIAPILVWAMLVPLWWYAVLRPLELARMLCASPDPCPVWPTWEFFVAPAAGVLIMVSAYLGVLWFACSKDEQRKIFRDNIWRWIIACCVAGALLMAGGVLAARLSWLQLAVLGPPWVVLSHMLQSMLYVALRKDPARGDLDREWLARVSAAKAMAGLGWLSFATTVLLLPLIDDSGVTLHALDLKWTSVAAAITAASGGLAAWLGKSARTAGAELWAAIHSKVRLPLEKVVALATFVFAVALFVLLGALATSLVNTLSERWASGSLPYPGLAVVVSVALAAAAAALGVVADRVINVNRFSMHATYRNRLSRAFLGSTMRAEQRIPDPWTGFDPFDNPRMADLAPWDDETKRPVLLPLIGMTLNLSGGSRWAERKGRPFTVTPLHCGFGDPPPGGLVYRRQQARLNRAGVKPPPVEPSGDGAYVQTLHYAGIERETGVDDPHRGITLATAMSLSGAAVSPSMGYHSRPATAFLMTLFNVRLGAWLPNPAIASPLEIEQARPPPRALLREMAGRIDENGKAVYLSDGGHFDNLGLYEAVRRRPRLIVVLDAGEDPDYQYDDLAMTLRKIRADLDASVSFKLPLEIGKPPPSGWAEADISYAEDGAKPPATLIYIKACKLGVLPPTLQQFAAVHKDFPHTATTKQFFQESTFESYRELGRLLGEAACERIEHQVRPPLAKASQATVKPAPAGAPV